MNEFLQIYLTFLRSSSLFVSLSLSLVSKDRDDERRREEEGVKRGKSMEPDVRYVNGRGANGCGRGEGRGEEEEGSLRARKERKGEQEAITYQRRGGRRESLEFSIEARKTREENH